MPLRTPACFWCNKLTNRGKTCPTCVRKTSLTGAIIPYRFTGHMKDIMYGLKYNGNQNLAKLLANKMSLHFEITQFDCVSFVPSTGKSQRKRGYNQAKLLAREVARQTGLPLQSTLLRLSHTDQIGLNRAQRLASVQDNFMVCRKVANTNILLVDDVITTGATINECARALKLAGAKSVWGLAVAKK